MDERDPLTTYPAARALAGAGTALVVLHIGAEHTQVVAGHAEAPSLVLTLDLGARSTGARWLRHDPPTPAELETAIMAVEDEVTTLARRLPDRAAWYTEDPGILQIAHVAGLDAAQARQGLPLAEVERVYAMLAAVALGQPALNSGVPTDPLFGATLLVLRECMHHLGIGRIHLLPLA